LPVLTGRTLDHRSAVFGTHTGNDNGGPGIANHCPARTIRTAGFRYIVNLEPDTTFTTHISGCKAGPHFLPFWNSWVEKAESNEAAAKIVDAYQHRSAEELFDVENDPDEMHNLAGDPDYETRKLELREQLAAWCAKQGDSVGAESIGKLDAR